MLVGVEHSMISIYPSTICTNKCPCSLGHERVGLHVKNISIFRDNIGREGSLPAGACLCTLRQMSEPIVTTVWLKQGLRGAGSGSNVKRPTLHADA